MEQFIKFKREILHKNTPRCVSKYLREGVSLCDLLFDNELFKKEMCELRKTVCQLEACFKLNISIFCLEKGSVTRLSSVEDVERNRQLETKMVLNAAHV